MPPSKRGVRRFFSKPKKGFRTSGKKKCWRGMKRPREVSVDMNNESSDSETTFQGFGEVPASQSLGDLEPHMSQTRQKIRVLSVFDGIGTGYQILTKELNMVVEKYFSSEVDEDALRVQQHNFGDNIIHLGCVKHISSLVLQDLGRIDLLIGGSPCSELSLVNPRRKNFDPSGSGALFFDYVRILKYFQDKKTDQPFYWLFENTSRMETKSLKLINKTLGCEPVTLCASQFVPMVRKRNFWGNLPGIKRYGLKPCTGDVPSLSQILPSYKTPVCEILPTLTGNVTAQRSGPGKTHPILYNGKSEYLCASDYELLFGFPRSYTDCGLSETARIKLIGRSWSIHVVKAILEPLRDLFKVNCL